jgi:hypothetical protein
MFSSPKKVQPQLSIDYPVLPTAGGDLLAAVLGCGSDAMVRAEVRTGTPLDISPLL